MSLAQLDRWFRRVGCERAEGLAVPGEYKGRRAYYLPAVGLTKASAAGERDMVKRVVLTTPARDRQGDIMVPTGVSLRWFVKNPVVLWAHRYDQAPIGTVDPGSIAVSESGIEADVVFDKGSVVGREVFGLYDRGVMRAWSIGFLPLEWELIEDAASGKVGGYRVTRWELLELSAVPVPANPEALSRQLHCYEARGYDPRLLPVVKALRASMAGAQSGPAHGETAAAEVDAEETRAEHDEDGTPVRRAEPSAAPERTAGAERQEAAAGQAIEALAQAVLARVAARAAELVEREFDRRRGAV